MSQRGSAPHRASHHSSFATPPSSEEGKALAAAAGNLTPSHPSSHPGAIASQPHLRDEPFSQRDMLSAEQGNSSGNRGSGDGGIGDGNRGSGRPSTRSGSMTTAGSMDAAAGFEDRRAQETPPRPFDVLNMLNPSDATDGGSRPLPRTRPGSASSHVYSRANSRANSRTNSPSLGMARIGGSGQQFSAPTLTAPASTPLAGGSSHSALASAALAASLDRESSPSMAHQYQSLGGPPRRILNPKSPRRVSAGRSMSSYGGNPYGRPGIASDLPPVPSLPPSMRPPMMGGAGTTNLMGPSLSAGGTPPRSFSHPIYPGSGGAPDSSSNSSGGPNAHPETPRGSVAHLHSFQDQQQQHQHPQQHHHQQQQQQQQQHQGQPSPSFPPPARPRQSQDVYGSSLGHGRGLSASGGAVGQRGESSPWSMSGMMGGGNMQAGGGVGGPGSGGQGMGGLGDDRGGRSVTMSEGQQFITITPSVGAEIHVPVDIHQASKQADEKRLRNAGASARFRARKKEKDREVQLGMQRLEALNRDLAKRMHETEMRCEFYRSERNRLWQAILQNPSMREQVEPGPPSPAPTSLSAGSFVAEGSPMSAGSMLSSQYPTAMHQHQQQQHQHQPQQPQQQPQHLSQSVHQQPQLQQLQHPAHPSHHPQRPPLPPMSTSPPVSGPPGLGPLVSDSPFNPERPARRRRTDSGPGADFHSMSYSSPLPTTLPPLPQTGFHSLTPSPLSGSPNIPNPRLPPLRLETAGAASAGSSVARMGGGGSAGFATASPTPEPMSGPSVPPPPGPYPPMTTTASSSSMYTRTYETAGWATDTPSPHQPHDQGHLQR